MLPGEGVKGTSISGTAVESSMVRSFGDVIDELCGGMVWVVITW
jgi:hypothetical protein